MLFCPLHFLLWPKSTSLVQSGPSPDIKTEYWYNVITACCCSLCSRKTDKKTDMLPLCRDRDPTSLFTVAVLIPAARQTHILNFQRNPPYPHRLLQSSVSVLLLHCAPAVRAHPQGQLQGTGCLASRRCTILAHHPSIRRCGTIFTLTSAQEAAIASRVGSSLVQAKRERCLVSAMTGIKREKQTSNKMRALKYII